MPFEPLPGFAAWRHTGSREGFEVTFFDTADDGYRITGHTTAVEEGRPWVVRYDITLDRGWLTRAASFWGWSEGGPTTRHAQCDEGRWSVDGVRRPDLDGCLDVDLESSAMTNTIPVHRSALAIGASARAPAAYVRAADLQVQRLDQRYARAPDQEGRVYDYDAPEFDFSCRLVYDRSGLIIDYPGIADRAG